MPGPDCLDRLLLLQTVQKLDKSVDESLHDAEKVIDELCSHGQHALSGEFSAGSADIRLVELFHRKENHRHYEEHSSCRWFPAHGLRVISTGTNVWPVRDDVREVAACVPLHPDRDPVAIADPVAQSRGRV